MRAIRGFECPTLHRDAVEQYAAGVRDGRGSCRARLGDTLELHQRPPGRRNLAGLPQPRRQRVVLPQGPALSAISQRQTDRLEGRLGPQLDVAIAAGLTLGSRFQNSPQRSTLKQMDDPWDKTSN